MNMIPAVLLKSLASTVSFLDLSQRLDATDFPHAVVNHQLPMENVISPDTFKEEKYCAATNLSASNFFQQGGRAKVDYT